MSPQTLPLEIHQIHHLPNLAYEMILEVPTAWPGLSNALLLESGINSGGFPLENGKGTQD